MLSERDENDIWKRLRDGEEERGRMDERLKAIEKTNGETKITLDKLDENVTKTYIRIGVVFVVIALISSGAVGAFIKYF